MTWNWQSEGFAFLFVLICAIQVLVDVNRYYDFCSNRMFNDSLGPLDVVNRNICYSNSSTRPHNNPPGRRPGALFGNPTRSLPAWIFGILLKLITTSFNVWLCYCSLKKTPSAHTGHNRRENNRVTWIIYICVVVIIVYEVINIAKIIFCRLRGINNVELAYAFAVSADTLVQGKCSSAL